MKHSRSPSQFLVSRSIDMMANEKEGRVVVDDPRAAKVGGDLDGDVVPKAMGKEEVEGRALGADGRVVAVKRSPRAHAFVSLRVEITDQ